MGILSTPYDREAGIARRQAREAIEKQARDNLCAVCGTALDVAHDPETGGPVLRCNFCGVTNPDYETHREASLKERFRKARSIEGAGFSERDAETCYQLMLQETRRAIRFGRTPDALTLQLIEQLEREQNGMTTERALAVQTSQPKQVIAYNAEEVAIIKEQIAPGVTDAELRLFIATAQRRGLDPFAKQIYAIRRRTKNQETNQWEYRMVMQTGIDGLRLIAARPGRYAGQDRPVFGPMIPDKYCAGGAHPEWCEMTGYLMVKGQRVAVTAQVWWDERVQTVGQGDNEKPNSMWCSQPRGMISKCSEALMLRKLAPEEMSGLAYDGERSDYLEGEFSEVAMQDAPELGPDEYPDVDTVTGEIMPSGVGPDWGGPDDDAPAAAPIASAAAVQQWRAFLAAMPGETGRKLWRKWVVDTFGSEFEALDEAVQTGVMPAIEKNKRERQERAKAAL